MCWVLVDGQHAEQQRAKRPRLQELEEHEITARVSIESCGINVMVVLVTGMEETG